MQKVIYFNQDCEVHAKEYAEDAHLQNIAHRISNGINQVAIGLCAVTFIVSVTIMLWLMAM